MKLRVILTIIVVLSAVWFTQSIGRPVVTVARNTAAVATLNGGDAAFVAQSAVDTTTAFPWTGVVSLGLVGLIWYSPIRKKISNKQS